MARPVSPGFLGGGWQCHSEQLWDDSGLRFIIFRRRPYEVIQVATPTSGHDWQITDLQEGDVAPDDLWFRIPRDIIEPFRDALLERAPVPDDGRLTEVREALKLERRRVDRVLHKLVD